MEAVYKDFVAKVPQLRRGQVWCTDCGHTQDVDSVKCLAEGWPLCCGVTMTLDSPSERAGMALNKLGEGLIGAGSELAKGNR